MNADPRVIHRNGFKLAELDCAMEHVALPFRQLLERRGEYHARYATSRVEGVAHSAVAKGGLLTVSIPGAGVIAVVAR